MNDRIEESVTQNGTDYVLSLSDHIRYVVAEVHDAVFAEIVFDGNAFLLQTGAFPVVGLVRDEGHLHSPSLRSGRARNNRGPVP